MQPRALYVLIGLGFAATAQTLPEIRVSNEITPIGGMAQMKVSLTSPKPITSGNFGFDASDVSFDSIDGIDLFSSTGDVNGAAVVSGGKIALAYISPGGTFGTNVDYPLMSVALRLSSTVVNGQKFPVKLDPSSLIYGL